MGLLDSERVPRRDLFIYFLIDCSSNMGGSKIGAVNDAMENLLVTLEEINNTNPSGDIILKVLLINDNPQWMYSEGKDVGDFVWQVIRASGDFYFGKALNYLTKDIIDSFDSYNYDPIFILLTSSPSVDVWEFSLKRLYNLETFDWGHKIAITIGDSCEFDMLRAFTRDEDKIFNLSNIDRLKNAIHITWSYPEWYASDGTFQGCKGDIALIIDKSIELFGKDIVTSSRMLHILNDYEAFKGDRAKKFIFNTIQNDSKFELLLNSNNWNFDSVIYSKRLSHDTGIDYQSIQCVIDAIGLGMGHTIYIDRKNVKI